MAEGKLILTYILFLLVLPHVTYSTEGTFNCKTIAVSRAVNTISGKARLTIMMTTFFLGLKFEFKNMTEETITRDENSTLRLLFTTVESPSTCNSTTPPESFNIVVSKTAEETEILGTICEYRHRHRVCVQTLHPNISCDCNNNTERIPYSFTKRLSRRDNGKWIWSTKPSGVIASKEITFNVTSSVTLLVAIASGVAALAAVIGFIVVAALMARRFSNGKKATEWYYKQNDKSGQTNQDLTHLLRLEKSTSKEIHQSELCQEHAVVLFLMEPTPLTMESTLKSPLVVSPEVRLCSLVSVFVGGPMECYTDVVDQLVGAQAPQPDASSHNYYYVAPDEILDRKQKARK
ncbi:hypothetical protein BaRGS_00027012 [Batillaria attramentaria]|uniref:Uncharacterized protein n=1 Tax=Batillaria attramentaria TaxID=370345 RepID=A0ABD0K3E1_9CAEN